MKQKYLIALLMAGMLVLAGCGGGSSGISEDDAKDRADQAVDDALAGITPCEGDGVMVDDNGKCVLDPDHMSSADMVTMAVKLHAALSHTFAMLDGGTGTEPSDRFPTTGNNAGDFLINNTGGETPLKKTDAAIPALAGWTGAQYTTMADGEIDREAHVYTKVSEAKPGNLFGTADTSAPLGTAEGAKHQYRLLSLSGSLKLAAFGISGNTIVPASIIMIDSFTQTAGSRTYENPMDSGKGYISESGSYHGVRGTFYCVVAAGSGCKVDHGDKGQSFAEANDWHFVPSNPSDRVTMGADAPLASYGWWLDKSANDGSWSVGVFDASRGGAVQALSGFNLGSGTAVYRGGAAGKYALTSSTGGRNEAGHFTASVELTAKFGTADTISGTVSSFKDGNGAGIDGGWSVALGESMIAGNGGISASGDDSKTTWSAGGTDGTAAGSWSGALWSLGDDGVPDVVTGTFNAHLGNDGRMAGAFGADHTAP